MEVLADLGGSASRDDVNRELEKRLSTAFGKEDLVPQADRGAEPRWQNRVSSLVRDLRRTGELMETASSGAGVWTLSATGRSHAAALLAARSVSAPSTRTYVPPARPSPVSATEPFVVDPDQVDRGLAAHHDTVQALRTWLVGRGITALAPAGGSPLFDLAWRDGPSFNVAEVKSTTSMNEERQLRLGLGQVLRYRHLTRSEATTVVAWLVLETKPSSDDWLDLCGDLQVEVWWPGK